MASKKLAPFGTSIFSEMSTLAVKHEAINLSQGFPDFEGPSELIEWACEALRSGNNQYARSMGHPRLVSAIAEKALRDHGLVYDPYTEVVVTSGGTEAIASTILSLIEPGDEVILLEPFYDSYLPCVAMAGGVPRFTTLRAPRFEVDLDELRSLFTARTRLLILNTPHNPTGKVFTRQELELIAKCVEDHDGVVLSDEVYEHLTFGNARHVPMASVPGMRERTISIGSTGKTFSLTGWKVGWATGPERLIRAVQSAHQFVTFATATPLQLAVAKALTTQGEAYFKRFCEEYTERRDYLVAALRDVGFDPVTPDGAYFVLAGFSRLSSLDDCAFARELVVKHKVAAIPPSVFYAARPGEGRKLLRFAFCKKMETLRAAAARLQAMAGRTPGFL